MRFLFINQHYAPDFAATAQQLADLAEHLASQGHEVHVLTSKAVYDGRPLDLPAEEVLNGVHVHRVSIGETRRDRLRQRLFGYLSFHARAHWLALRLPKPDVVISLTTPPLISLAGVWMRWLRGCAFVYWVMDVYPDIAVRAGVLRRFGPARGIWSMLAQLCYRAAHRVIVLSPGMRDALEKRGVPEEKVAIVPSWSPAETIRPIASEANPFREEHVPSGSFAVMYSGNMGTCHLWKEIADAVGLLRNDPSIRFLFVGGGKNASLLRKEVEGERNVRFLAYQDREKLGESLGAGDLHLITLDERFEGLLLPCKLYGIMAAGRPVLYVGSEHGDIAKIIRETRCGVVVPPGRGDLLAAELRRLAADPAELQAMGQRGRECFEKFYTAEAVVPRMAMLLERIAGRTTDISDFNTEQEITRATLPRTSPERH